MIDHYLFVIKIAIICCCYTLWEIGNLRIIIGILGNSERITGNQHENTRIEYSVKIELYLSKPSQVVYQDFYAI